MATVRPAIRLRGSANCLQWGEHGLGCYMTEVKRPRVAAVGLDDLQIEAVAPLCGEVRSASSITDYLSRFSWTETDLVIVGANADRKFEHNIHMLTINTTCCWTFSPHAMSSRLVYMNAGRPNTEREVRVGPTCPADYKILAAQLCKQLRSDGDPPQVLAPPPSGSDEDIVLVETTSARPVAVRHLRARRPWEGGGAREESVVVAIPQVPNLSAWFRAFLTDVHHVDPVRVPHPPPRLGNPADWYTPEERRLAHRITETRENIEQLQDELEQLETALRAEGERSDGATRRILWADGDELVAAVSEILTRLGFTIRDMDSELESGSPKREDLRLTLAGQVGWEAIVEVKGYTKGTRTSDARQIREYRDDYIIKKGRPPDLTMWVANPHRGIADPSSRPAPDVNVAQQAASIDAVHVLASDLYRLWAQVASGALQDSDAMARLASASPGCWNPTT